MTLCKKINDLYLHRIKKSVWISFAHTCIIFVQPSLLELLKNQKEDSRDDSLTTPLKTFILSDYKFDFKHPARSDQSPNSSASKEVKNIETNDDQCSPEENNTVVVNASSLSEPPLKSNSNIPDVAHIEIAPLNAVTSKNIEDGNTLDTELDSLLESKPISSNLTRLTLQ